MPKRKSPEPQAAEIDQWDEEMQKLQWTPKHTPTDEGLLQW